MSIANPEKKTPREWSREWLIRADMAGAEASPSEVVEVIVTEAVAYERERLATWAREQGRSHHMLSVEAHDAKDEERGTMHTALSSAYFRLADEVRKESRA